MIPVVTFAAAVALTLLGVGIQRPTASFETSNTYVCRTVIAGAGCLGRRW
jgi:hypothetical protein